MKRHLILYVLAVLTALWFSSCGIPPSPAVQAHAAAGAGSYGLSEARQAQNNFWK